VPEQFRKEESITIDERHDGAFLNMLTGMGIPGRDKNLATSLRSSPLIDGWSCDQLYINGIPRRFIDAIADEIYKHPASIELGQELSDSWEEFIPKFDEYLKGINFNSRLAECIRLQRLYGGAVLVMLIDDGLPANEPVDFKRIRSITDIVPLSRYEIVPEQFNMVDPSKPEFYRITTSQKLEPGQTLPFTYFQIHRSRIARFDGLYLPWSLRSTNIGWGMSCMQLLLDAYKRYTTALKGLEQMTSDFDLFIHKIPNLFNRVASGNEDDLRKRMEANTLSRSVYNGMLVDKEEEVEFINRNVGGISGLTAPFLEELQAVTGWPASYLTGVSPGGLGKEGRYEERVWASIVENWQQNYVRAGVTEVFTMCMLAKDCPSRGRLPESWSVKFPSVFTQTEDEEAELRLKISQSDAQYVQMGVLAPSELRDSRFGGTSFQIDTTLSAEVSQRLEEKAQLEFESMRSNYEAQQQALTQPLEAYPELGLQTEAASEPEALPEPEILPTGSTKTDSIEYAEAGGIRIKVSNKAANVVAGHPVAPDGQRMDVDGRSPQIVIGPVRSRSTPLYRSLLRVDDDRISEGPYVTGFSMTRLARKALRDLYPDRIVEGLRELSAADADLLRASWEQY
jgi:phage-related protein (TIGR01555 family)